MLFGTLFILEQVEIPALFMHGYFGSFFCGFAWAFLGTAFMLLGLPKATYK